MKSGKVRIFWCCFLLSVMVGLPSNGKAKTIKAGMFSVDIPENSEYKELQNEGEPYEATLQEIQNGIIAAAPPALLSGFLVPMVQFPSPITRVDIGKVRAFIAHAFPPAFVLPNMRDMILSTFFTSSRFGVLNEETVRLHKTAGPGNSVSVMVIIGPDNEVRSECVGNMVCSLRLEQNVPQTGGADESNFSNGDADLNSRGPHPCCCCSCSNFGGVEYLPFASPSLS